MRSSFSARSRWRAPITRRHCRVPRWPMRAQSGTTGPGLPGRLASMLPANGPAAGPEDDDLPGRCRGQAWPMNVDGLSGLVNRVIAWADRLQRRHGVLGFPHAVIKKYGDDAGGRQAALITYYGFLSIFPLLLGVA